MPLQSTSGAASYDAFGGGAAAKVNYIEDCFVSWLSTGNGTSRTVTGPDMTTGGLSITKSRSAATGWHFVDTARGAGNSLSSNTTAANASESTGVTTFTATGTSIGAAAEYNTNGATYVDYLLKKQPKFFDVVTWTGNAANRTIAHNLGSVPGCIIVKRTDSTGFWSVYHRGLGDTPGLNPEKFVLYLQTTNAQDGYVDYWNMTLPTSTQFSIGANSVVNANGGTYVAYVFAHNAGGFGLTGTDNVISCGSYTGTGAVGNKITLGYEPQWLLIKRTDTANSWYLFDTMRGLSLTQSLALLPNGTNSDLDYGSSFQLNADGVTQNNANSAFNASGGTYIYIAIRRGPMKVPTSGTSVFSPVAYTGNATDTTRSAGFPVDMLAILRRSNPFGDGDGNPRFMDRLRGGNSTSLISSSSSAEETSTNNTLYLDNSVGFKTTANNAGAPTGYYFNVSTNPYIAECFRRAPSFFDEVCYTGTGSARTINHNLGVAPELVFIKQRSDTGGNWFVGSQFSGTGYNYSILNSASSGSAFLYTDGIVYNAAPTTTTLSLSNSGGTNGNTQTYVAYLFATCAGVSKVGSYTGNGSSQTINCGFTSGARFVLIKSTSAAGHWRVYDTARGIVAGNEPELFLNLTNAEQTVYDAIDTDSSGFIVNSNGANVNDSGVTYIFLAIA